MNSKIFIIIIGIAFISMFIYFVKNFKDIKNKIIDIKNKKYFKIAYIFIIILIIILMLLFIWKNIEKIVTNIKNYAWSMNNDKFNEYFDTQITKENIFYKDAINKEYDNQKPKEPYIPEGYFYVEGEWNNGFVIQDKIGNQYVWVPCTNKDKLIEGVEKLERKNFSRDPFISKDICINEGCEKFINSCLENGGFYISRFEIGLENNKYVSKANKIILSNVTKNEAIEAVNQMNTNENINCELINGYAYDTTLSWINNTNDININKYDCNEEILTGREKYNNIYDFIDNILEITLETTYGNVIIRGFLLNNENIINCTIEEFGYDNDSMGRISIREIDNYFTIDTIMGVRTILYK